MHMNTTLTSQSCERVGEHQSAPSSRGPRVWAACARWTRTAAARRERRPSGAHRRAICRAETPSASRESSRSLLALRSSIHRHTYRHIREGLVNVGKWYYRKTVCWCGALLPPRAHRTSFASDSVRASRNGSKKKQNINCSDYLVTSTRSSL